MTRQKAILVVATLLAVGAVALVWPRASVTRPVTTAKTATFEDVAIDAGIEWKMQFLPSEQGETFKTNLYDHGCGVVIGDYNGDGHDDVYFLNQLGPNALYRNKGDGTFEDATEQAGVGLEDRICVGGTFADYDNDGDQDLFVTSTRGGNVLFENLGKGKFADVTEKAGVDRVAHSQTASFIDFDNDGFLDLYVTNTAQWTLDEYDAASAYFPGRDWLELFTSPIEHNILFRNNRDGTFSDVSESSGLKGKGWGGDVGILDFDEDGDLDLFVTNMFGLSQLYRNEGGMKFTDVTEGTLARTSFGAIGSRFFDFDNDGQLDLYIVDMHSDMWMPPESGFEPVAEKIHSQKYKYLTGPKIDYYEKFRQEEEWNANLFRIEYDKVVFGNTLFKNLGGGKFEEVSDRAGLETLWPWGICAGDFDNDGYSDIFLPSGMGYPYSPWRNYLLMNNGNETFQDRSLESGVHPPSDGLFLPEKIGGQDACRSSRCAAVSDFDGDGRLDIVVNNFNDRPYYYKNRFPQENFVAFRLTGSVSNKDAIGAVVRLYRGDQVMARQIHPATGYLSQSSKTIHFGLGDSPKIDRIEIRWPSGTVQQIEEPQANQVHQVIEPNDAPTRAGDS